MVVRQELRSVALRYGAVVVLAAATQLAGLWFYSAGVYGGRSNIALRRFPEDVDFIFVWTFAASIIGLKYVVYEFTAKPCTRTRDTPATRIWFYAAYAIALVIDLASLFLSSRPIADAGFAMLGAVLYSPPVLIAAAFAIAAMAYWNARRHTRSATHAPER